MSTSTILLSSIFSIFFHQYLHLLIYRLQYLWPGQIVGLYSSAPLYSARPLKIDNLLHFVEFLTVVTARQDQSLALRHFYRKFFTLDHSESSLVSDRCGSGESNRNSECIGMDSQPSLGLYSCYQRSRLNIVYSSMFQRYNQAYLESLE